MSKKLIISGVAITIGLASILYIFKSTNKQKTKPKGFQKFNPKGMKIAFMGDSYTAMANWGWQSVLAKNYSFKEINKAKGGMRTSWMLQQTQDYLSKEKPDYYFIMGGANDAYSSVTISTAIKNIQQIIDTANEYGVKPIVVIGYNARKVQVENPRQKPTKSQISRGITQSSLWDMGEKYYQMQLAMRNLKNAVIVPIWEGAEQSDAPDGLHLSAKANTRLADYVGNFLFTKN